EKKEIVLGSLSTIDGSPVTAVRLLSPGGSTDGLYAIQHLVPISQCLPFRFLSVLAPAQASSLLIPDNNLFASGRALALIKSIWGKIGASISLSLIYPKQISEQVRDGASLVVNVSNLSWFHNAILSRQVLAAGVLRAVENERYVVVASNTGISAVIAP